MVLLATTGGTPADEHAAVTAFAARRADSIVIAGSRSSRPGDQESNADLAAELDPVLPQRREGKRAGTRHCRSVGTRGVPRCGRPQRGAGCGAAGTLAQVHSGEFVIIGGPEGLLTSDDRIRGYQSGLAAAGLPPAEILRAGFDRTGGYEAGTTLAHRIISARKGSGSPSGEGSRPCIFAANDVMAIGAVAALRGEGLRIPRDALIAGFDDIETLRDFRPPLSTVSLPLEEIGRLAALGSAAGRASQRRERTRRHLRPKHPRRSTQASPSAQS